MCLGGHLVRISLQISSEDTKLISAPDIQAFRVRLVSVSRPGLDITFIYPQAAFDPRVLSAFCFFATDIHSATLGKGKSDDTLIRVRNGELTGRGEVVVRPAFFVPQIIEWDNPCRISIQMVFGKQDTHVPREGRDLIRKTLEDANVTASVRILYRADSAK